MFDSFTFILRTTCLWALLLKGAATSSAQTVPEQAPGRPPLKTVSATQSSAQAGSTVEVADTGQTHPPASEPFHLPVEQHPWARFQPGAWREFQTETESFDENGLVISRGVTTQKEVLEAVGEGKYILKVQATVELSGKRIVGDWKTHVYHLATDHAGPIVDSQRGVLDPLKLTGKLADCQLWEVHYGDGTRQLVDRIAYDPERFPFVLLRETHEDRNPKDAEKDAAKEAEQTMKVVAFSVPYLHHEQLFDCCCIQALRHRAKGDTARLTFLSRAVPGGEVASWSTDSDAQGRRIRWSVSKLLDSGDTSPEAQDSSGIHSSRPPSNP